jgi:hypothetical protein
MYFVEGMAQYISITLSTIQGSTWPKDMKAVFYLSLTCYYMKICKGLLKLQDDYLN